MIGEGTRFVSPLFSSIIILGGFITVDDELISSGEIYLQDIVCSVVGSNLGADDFIIYNIVSTMVEIPSLEITRKILELIKLNKSALNI